LGTLFCFFGLPIILCINYSRNKNKHYFFALRELAEKFNLVIENKSNSYEWRSYRGVVGSFKLKIGSYADSKVLKGSGGICNKVSLVIDSRDEFWFSVVKMNLFQAIGQSLDKSCVEIQNALLKDKFVFRTNNTNKLESLLTAKVSQLILDLWDGGNHFYYCLTYSKGTLAFSNSTNFRPQISVEKYTLGIMLLSELADNIQKIHQSAE